MAEDNKELLDNMTDDFYKLGLSYALAMIERVPVEMAIKEIKEKISKLERGEE